MAHLQKVDQLIEQPPDLLGLVAMPRTLISVPGKASSIWRRC
jgi:hypothetical protein